MKFTHKRLTSLDDLVGRTIDAVVGDYSHSLGLRFTDGAFFYVAANATMFSFSERDAELDYEHSDFVDVDEARALGVIDEAERTRINEENRLQREQIDRANYEAMKARFEPKEAP